MNMPDDRVDLLRGLLMPSSKMVHAGRGFEVVCGFGHKFGISELLAAIISAHAPTPGVVTCPSCLMPVCVEP